MKPAKERHHLIALALRTSLLAIGMAATTSLSLGLVHAVEVDDIEAVDTAGAVGTRFGLEQEEEEKETARRAWMTDVEISLTDEQEEEKAPLPETITFTLNEVKITGNQSVSTSDLEQAASDYLGQEVDFETLEQIASAMKAVYRNQGFVAGYVYLPPQEIEGGIVEFRAIEGRIGNVLFQGNRWFSSKVLGRALRLRPGTILKYETLRGRLAHLNRHRDISATTILSAGKETGTTDVKVDVKDKFPLHLSTDVNNLGTANTGRARWGLTAMHTNLFGQMDSLYTRLQLGSRVSAIAADYRIPVTDWDTKLGFAYSFAQVDVGRDFDDLDVKGTSVSYKFYLKQPILQTEKAEVNTGISFDIKEIQNRALGRNISEDDLRVLAADIDASIDDKRGKNIFTQSFRFGFSSVLGGSHKIDRDVGKRDAGAQFFLSRTAFTRYHRLPHDIVWSLRTQVQVSPDRLVSSEALRLGGAFSVRGYPEGEYLADTGAYVSNEILVPTYFFPKDWKLPFSKQPLRTQLRGTAFFDFGGGRLNDDLAGETSHRTLSGVGLGVRMHLFDRVYGRFHWATPTSSRGADASNSAFYFGIGAEVF